MGGTELAEAKKRKLGSTQLVAEEDYVHVQSFHPLGIEENVVQVAVYVGLYFVWCCVHTYCLPI